MRVVVINLLRCMRISLVLKVIEILDAAEECALHWTSLLIKGTAAEKLQDSP